MEPVWREKIMTWYARLGEHYGLHEETLSMATNYLDRFLSRKSCDTRQFMLVALACVVVATKVDDDAAFGDMSRWLKLGDGQFRSEDLKACEVHVLETLRFDLHPPTAGAAAGYFLRLLDNLPAGTLVERSARRLVKLARSDARCSARWSPTKLALSAVRLALRRGAPASLEIAWARRVLKTRLFERRDLLTLDAEISSCGVDLLDLEAASLQNREAACLRCKSSCEDAVFSARSASYAAAEMAAEWHACGGAWTCGACEAASDAASAAKLAASTAANAAAAARAAERAAEAEAKLDAEIEDAFASSQTDVSARDDAAAPATSPPLAVAPRTSASPANLVRCVSVSPGRLVRTVARVPSSAPRKVPRLSPTAGARVSVSPTSLRASRRASPSPVAPGRDRTTVFGRSFYPVE